MNYQLGDTVVVKSKRRMMKHIGRVVELDQDEEFIIITNGFETVRVDLYGWEVRKI